MIVGRKNLKKLQNDIPTVKHSKVKNFARLRSGIRKEITISSKAEQQFEQKVI